MRVLEKRTVSRTLLLKNLRLFFKFTLMLCYIMPWGNSINSAETRHLHQTGAVLQQPFSVTMNKVNQTAFNTRRQAPHVYRKLSKISSQTQGILKTASDITKDGAPDETPAIENGQPRPPRHFHQTVYGNLIIREIEYHIDGVPISEIRAQQLREQTFIKTGTSFSQYAIQREVKALYQSQAYAQIQCYAQIMSEGVVLAFYLTSAARIKEIELNGVTTALRGIIRNTIQSKRGEAYVPASAENDVGQIKAVCAEHGYFDADVNLKVNTVEAQQAAATQNRTDTPDGYKAITLIYQITLGARSRITALHIRGNAAMSAGRIKTVCYLGIDDIYQKSAVQTDVQSIRELYRKNRYYTPTIIPKFYPETGVLAFYIEEGKRVLLEFTPSDIKIDEDGLIASANFSATSPFLWRQSIIRYFEQNGYVDTTVSEVPHSLGPIKGQGAVKFIINPGIRYVVTRNTFSGNTVFSNEQLLREMELRPTGRGSKLFGKKRFFHKQLLKKDKQRLEILYEKAGYHYASIRISAIPDKENTDKQLTGEITIHVAITESYKEVIHRCRFSGNQTLSTDRLLRQLPSDFQLPQPNVKFVRTAYENSVKKFYHERGYIDATVEVRYVAQTRTPIFQIEGNFAKPLDEGRLPGNLQMEFVNRDLPLAGTFIALKIGEVWSIRDRGGNPRYSLTQRETHLEVFEHGILDCDISEGEQIYFGTFRFEGDSDVKEHVLTREIKHLEGTRYAPTKLEQALQNLYNTGIFQRVQAKQLNRGGAVAPKLHEAGTPVRASALKTRNIAIELQKQKPGAYSNGIGYSSLDGFRLAFGLRHWNLFKRNARADLRGRLGTRGYLYDVTLMEPWLLRRIRGSLQFSGRNLEEDDNVRALQASFILSREFANTHQLDLQYNYRHLRQLEGENIKSARPPIAQVQQTTVSSLRFTWTHDSRAPYLNPTSGMLNKVTLEYAGGFLAGETSFVKTTTDIRYYRRLGTWGPVLATAVRFGITNGLRLNRMAALISFERFWAGGMNTIRGYTERGLGPLDMTGRHRGDVRLIFNTELRSPPYNLFGILLGGAVFFDTGNVWGALDDVAAAPMPAAAGAGLRLTLGPVTARVDYAVPLFIIPGVSQNRFYVQLGNAF